MRSRRLAVVWVTLAALGAGIVAIEGGSLLAPTPVAPTGRLPLFTFAEPDLGEVEVIYEGRRAVLMRDDAGAWFQHRGQHAHAAGAAQGEETHRADAQEAARIAQTLAVSARMLVDRRLTPDRDLGAYGLATPATVMTFYGREPGAARYARPLAVLYVGDLLTTEYAYYTRLEGDADLSLLPRYQVTLLLALVFGEENVPTPLPAVPATG